MTRRRAWPDARGRAAACEIELAALRLETAWDASAVARGVPAIELAGVRLETAWDATSGFAEGVQDRARGAAP